jgi:acyl carrier protein
MTSRTTPPRPFRARRRPGTVCRAHQTSGIHRDERGAAPGDRHFRATVPPAAEPRATEGGGQFRRNRMEQIEQEVRSFVADNFVPLQDGHEIAVDESLTRSGVIDSVGIVELMLFLEATYGIDIPDAEAVPENLDTLRNIARYVRAKRIPDLPGGAPGRAQLSTADGG